MSTKELSREDALGVYLNNHLVGASAGVDLFRRVAGSHTDPEVRAAVRRLVGEVTDDRSALLAVMRRLGIRPSLSRSLLGRVGERLGRLKPNGSLFRRSDVTDLIELEALTLGVRGKLACWHALRPLAERDQVIDSGQMDSLIERAEGQLAELESLRRRVASAVFGAD